MPEENRNLLDTTNKYVAASTVLKLWQHRIPKF